MKQKPPPEDPVSATTIRHWRLWRWQGKITAVIGIVILALGMFLVTIPEQVCYFPCLGPSYYAVRYPYQFLGTLVAFLGAMTMLAGLGSVLRYGGRLIMQESLDEIGER